MACPSAPAEEVCFGQVVAKPVGIIVAERHEGGSALGLNLVLVQNPWARAAASQGATVGRQDIPAQDEETSVTTCYANPRAREGKRGEGAWTVKTASTGTVCLCVHWQEL